MDGKSDPHLRDALASGGFGFNYETKEKKEEEKRVRESVWKNAKLGLIIYSVLFLCCSTLSLLLPLFLSLIFVFIWYSYWVVGAPISIKIEGVGEEEEKEKVKDKKEGRTLAMTFKHSLSVCIGTWNSGDSPPNSSSFSDWMPNPGKYGVIAVGVQECFFTKYDKSRFTSCEDAWWDMLTDFFGENFTLIAAHSVRNSIRLGVFVRNSLLPFVSEIRVGHIVNNIPVGYRKGAVCIGFKIYDTGLCFYNAHLTAHYNQKYILARNHDVFRILNGVRLGHPLLETGKEYQHTFFFGDLNYRIEMKKDDLFPIVDKRDWSALHPHDQLIKERAKGNAFTAFHDCEPNFRPTYKLKKIPADQISLRERNYNTNRIPAWCDRILYSSFPGYSLRCCEFECCEQIVTSDHNPVRAAFEVELKHFVPKPIGKQVDMFIFVVELDEVVFKTLPPSSQEKERGENNKDNEREGEVEADINRPFTLQTPERSLSFLRVFSSETQNKVITSPKIRGTEKNIWCFPPMKPLMTFPISLECFKDQCFAVAVYNLSSNISSDFCVGQGLISLSSYQLSPEINLPFNEMMDLGGIHHGVLSGNLYIRAARTSI